MSLWGLQQVYRGGDGLSSNMGMGVMKEAGASGYMFRNTNSKQGVLWMGGQPRGLPGELGPATG